MRSLSFGHCFVFAALLAGVLLGTGCDEAAEEAQEPTSPSPLRPLVYTEQPELTPEGAAVRERRLMRQLLEGSEASGAWGGLEAEPAKLDASASSPQSFAQSVFRALVTRDEALWDAVFVEPVAYAGLVHVDREQAREFVDEIQGQSAQTWRIFEPEPVSEAPEGGFGAILELEGLDLGDPRALSGALASEEEPAAQYWNNVLKLRLRGTEVVFELRIAKILLARRAGHQVLQIASRVKADERLKTLRRSGVHLKSELLRSQEYPFPLQVGNFWRYRRTREISEGDAPDPFEEALGEASGATETMTTVASVDRYRGYRLVQLRRSYNDAELTNIEVWWLVTPRAIYVCDMACREHVEDLGWLLGYFDRSVPIFEFPLRDGAGWGAGGGASKKPVFEVEAVSEVAVPAGVFGAAVAIRGQGPFGAFDARLARPQTRIFSYGRGIVRRELEGPDGPMYEELVEYRIMP